MITEGRKVVVISPASTFYDAGWRTHVAAFPRLGLATFGDTAEVALARLKDSFRDFIDTHRKQGVLEATLNELDVTWHWEDEYPDDGPEYEDTTKSHDPPEAVAVQQTVVEVAPPAPPEWSVPPETWSPTGETAAERDLVAAA